MEPVVAGSTRPRPEREAKPATPPGRGAGEADTAVADRQAPGVRQAGGGGRSRGRSWKPAKKPAAPKPKPAVDPLADERGRAEAGVARPSRAPTPKPAVATTPKPATAAAKPAKKPTKVWVDPFAK